MDNTLFDLPSPEARPPPPEGRAEPRLQRPNREQVELRPVDLESLLPADHRARVVWEFVEGLDRAPLEAEIKAVEGHAGRPAIDPAILMALWLYATVEGVGSARAIARLCEEHDAYRWLGGGGSGRCTTIRGRRRGGRRRRSSGRRRRAGSGWRRRWSTCRTSRQRRRRPSGSTRGRRRPTRKSAS